MSQTNSSFPFASARVKAMEQRLITKEKLSRLIEAKDFDAAMRLLAEYGYGHGVSQDSFEPLIQKELSETDKLLEALSPSDIFTRIMRAERDYHNLKVIIKLMLRDGESESAELYPGNISIDALKYAINENNYFSLPDTIKEALEYIDRQFAVLTDASIIGAALDRAYAKEVDALAVKMGDPVVSAYFEAFFDMTNIIALLRVRAADAEDKESFERACLRGGKISKRTLIEAYDIADDGFLAAAAKGKYADILAGAFADYQKTGSLYMMEKARDDYLGALLQKSRFDMFGIGPLMCYYIAKQREAAAVRMVMTAKQGGIEPDDVDARLKELLI